MTTSVTRFPGVPEGNVEGHLEFKKVPCTKNFPIKHFGVHTTLQCRIDGRVRPKETLNGGSSSEGRGWCPCLEGKLGVDWGD